MSDLNNDKKESGVGFFNSLRWSIGEIIGQLLAVPAVIISAYLGFIYQSWSALQRRFFLQFRKTTNLKKKTPLSVKIQLGIFDR